MRCKCKQITITFLPLQKGVSLKKRIISFLLISMFAFAITAPNVFAADIDTYVISGRPSLRIEGTTAYCTGKYSSGNKNDYIEIVITLKQGEREIKSWSAAGRGTATVSKTYTVQAKKTYQLILSAKVNGKEKPSVTVTATVK